MNIPRIIAPIEPAMLEQPIFEMQKILADNIDWLQHIFGKTQLLVRKKDNRNYNYPAAFYKTRNTDYFDLSPSKQFGNYCFFKVDENQSLTVNQKPNIQLSCKISLIFWFDLDSIELSDDRRIEYIKNKIVEVLIKKIILKNGSYKLNYIFEEAKNIYKEFSILEEDSQFLMHPYCSLRFEGDLIWHNLNTCG